MSNHGIFILDLYVSLGRAIGPPTHQATLIELKTANLGKVRVRGWLGDGLVIRKMSGEHQVSVR